MPMKVFFLSWKRGGPFGIMHKKKIILISPTASDRKTQKALRIPEIALSIIAAFTPEEFEVDVVEEDLQEINYDIECDIVGISCMTANAPRGYEIAKEFKKRGKTVVFGGIHPTVLPDEALQYGDSVIIGEAENSWENFLADYLKGDIQPTYRSNQPDVSDYPFPKRDLSRKKGLFNVKPILTTRGCPFNCNFCCVPEFFGKKLRHLPPEKVVGDIVAAKSKNFLFLDDNIIGNPKYALKLFEAIAPLKIKWVGQASITFVKKEELMRAAQKSGCVSLFFGVESVSKSQLNKMRKSLNEIHLIEEAIQKVKDLGIAFHASMVFGFDDDTISVFDETLEFLMRNKIGTGSYNILTPYPGTEIYKQFKAEGRLLTENWRYFDHNTVVFKPKNMTPMELAEGHLQFRKDLYSLGSIAKRLPGNLSHPFLYLFMNMAQRIRNKEMTASLHDNMECIMNDPKFADSTIEEEPLIRVAE